LNKNVLVEACLGEIEESGRPFNGTVTSYDDKFICLNNNTSIVKKYILAITIM